MIIHPELQVLIIEQEEKNTISPWAWFGSGMDHVHVAVTSAPPSNLDDYHAVITVGTKVDGIDTDQLLGFVARGGAWLAADMLSEQLLPDAFGVQPGPIGPRSELRLLFTRRDHPLGARLPDAVYIDGRYQPLLVNSAAVETLLYVDWHYSHSSVLTTRQHGAGQLACTTLQDFTSQMVCTTIYRLLRTFQGSAPSVDRSFGIGILGYAPSVGKLHGLAVERTSGLHLAAACDLNPGQLAQASVDFPGITAYTDAAGMARDPDIDLVIVATAPNSHASLTIEMLAAGKHVLCEKPLAVSLAETESMAAAAERHQRHLSCHQNRRFDPDFLAIKEAIAGGQIGELFYLETFVGGFHHPCGYWHSHAPVSGGTSFDWGAHYIDWLVALVRQRVESVVGTRHKRVWHDVTNGDQERIQVRFADGREAEFLHSDIAAARKPKWYMLGTAGAIVGRWRDVTAIGVDPVYYFSSEDIPATEMMPEIALYRRSAGGAVEATTLALPRRNPYLFHANLADHLLWGEPLAAPLADSIRVVSILEAAARSMAHGGRVEAVNGN